MDTTYVTDVDTTYVTDVDKNSKFFVHDLLYRAPPTHDEPNPIFTSLTGPCLGNATHVQGGRAPSIDKICVGIDSRARGTRVQLCLSPRGD